MMVAMVGCPPQRSPLDCTVPKDSEKKLYRSGGLEGAVRKIAVVEARDREHAHNVEGDRQDNCRHTPSDPDYCDTTQVKK